VIAVPDVPATVLNVDDDPAGRAALSALLRHAGLEVREASSGEEALRLASEHPDLILLDVRLPDRDGRDVCRRLKADPATAPIPVLMLSGLAVRSEDRVSGLDTGAEGYLVKPVEPEELLAHIRALLRTRQAEERLRQSERLEAVGRLAAGVAHDLNNVLTVINGCSELLLEGIYPQDPLRELVVEIRQAGERAAALTRQLLAFSRKQVLAPQVVRLDEVVSGLEPMLRRLIGGGDVVRLTVTRDGTPAWVRADPVQIEQVVVNLAVNARDAMPGGGELTIEMGTATPGGRPHAVLAVSDTGVGMSEAVRVRLFEPFFTTKGPGRGTGLGLATVYGIVEQSGGRIEVDSAPGRGSTFRVYLPQVVAPAALPAEAPAAPPAGAKGGETVLVVEDDDAVRALTRACLEARGYAVLAAGDAEEAGRVAADYPGRIDLMVTDVVMPGCGGRELAGRLTAARPGLRVLYVSGHTEDAVLRHGVRDAEVAFLQKPFLPDALARKVRELLDAGSD
jgi:two-component system cell cycle sensor histidine kinase/response regulator CckA